MQNAFTRFVARRLTGWGANIVEKHQPDFVIGDPDDPCLIRWCIFPRNRFLNVYLHLFLRSDDRVLHDHPWWSWSLALSQVAYEIHYPMDGPREDHLRIVNFGDFIHRPAKFTHRMVLRVREDVHQPFMTLFITGPRLREWGFWCDKGTRFVPWQEFTKNGVPGERGKGCD